MFKFLTLSQQLVLLFLVITLATSIHFSQAKLTDDLADSSNDEVQDQRRMHDFNKLRHFLLTSNAEERTAKRDKQNFYKRQLIREYLQSVTDHDSNRLQELKKRIITFCNSYEDIMNSDRATCG